MLAIQYVSRLACMVHNDHFDIRFWPRCLVLVSWMYPLCLDRPDQAPELPLLPCRFPLSLSPRRPPIASSQAGSVQASQAMVV